MPKIEIPDEIRTAFAAAYNSTEGYSSGITAGLAAVIPLIEARISAQLDPYAAQANAYAQLLDQHAAVIAAPIQNPEPTATDLRFRALQLAVEHDRSRIGELHTIRVAEMFREYLETGATDAD